MLQKYPGWILYLREKAIYLFHRYSLPRWMVFLIDTFSAFIFYYIAYVLRLNFNFEEINFVMVFHQALMALFVYCVFSLIFRSYTGLLRHTTLTDISQVFIVTTMSFIVLFSLSIASRIFRWGENFSIPLSVILIHYVSITVFLFSVRIFIKLLFRFATSSLKDTKKVLIYGAGELGFTVKRVILSDPDYGFSVSGFIDDDKNLQGKKINGIPVFSPFILTRAFLARNKIETLILAIKNLSVDGKSKIIRQAIDLGLEVLETPEVDKWMYGQLQVRQFQRVKLEDLLGRQPIELNLASIRNGLHNKTIMVTGAAGSIGSEIVRQLTRFNSRKIILVDQAETPIFNLDNELREKFRHLQASIVLADITHLKKMESVFRMYKPDIVFHAAAYKHVPMMEGNPHEAVRVNIGGTKNVSDLALKYKVEKFVMISTDKSVNPTSVMGASKRVCEKIVQARAQQKGITTQFVITRFGNVLGSNGSVIPIFSKQIEQGGPVTVTHPDIIRYFMTIPEACQLVLEAGFMGNGGEIFVFDMGKPVKIAELAKQMIRLYGLIPGKDIEIVYTGLRPGEKLYEELLTDKETTLSTHHPKIKKARVEMLDGDLIRSRVDEVLNHLYELTRQDVVDFLKEIVPEYQCTQGNLADV